MAPKAPDGFQTGEPDFVCIGAQRSGTTRLAMLLASHPEFHFPDYFSSVLKPNRSHFISVKERHYFERTTFGLSQEEIEEYHRWFPRPEGHKTGEFTRRYLYDFWVAEQLYSAAPHTKLIVMLRDPVERFWSGCHFSGMNPATFNEHFQRGLYANQLARWYKHFDQSAVLAVQFERFNKSPVESYQDICRFIGIDDTIEPAKDNVEAVVNATKSKTQMPASLRENMARLYRDDVEKFFQMHPNLDRSLWRNFSD